MLNNCVLAGNWAGYGGGGAAGGTLHNCLVCINRAPNAPNWSGREATEFACSCTTPLPEAEGNLALDPLLVIAASGDFRLRPDSPCINAGSNELVGGDTDLGGHPRTIGGKVDMGAYEFDRTVPFITVTGLTPAGLRIEWLASARGSTLKRSVTLNPPQWQDVPGSEAVTSLTVPLTDATGYFRLVKR